MPADLIDSLVRDGWLKTPRIIDAFRKIKREDFLPPEMKGMAEINEALPIGFGQTISQPLTVAFMLEKLQPEVGDRILDVGSGSGWTTALLAAIVGGKGQVTAIEIVPGLYDFGRKNLSKYDFVKTKIAHLVLGDGSKGYKEGSPYDKILASASAEDLPVAWKEQLNPGGRIVAPLGNSIWLFIKKRGENKFEGFEYPGFAFVPLIVKQWAKNK